MLEKEKFGEQQKYRAQKQKIRVGGSDILASSQKLASECVMCMCHGVVGVEIFTPYLLVIY